MLELKNVFKKYNTKTSITDKTLDNISLKFGNSGIVFIVGDKESGKNTLIDLIGGIIKPDSGEIIYNDITISSLDEKKLDSYRNTVIGFIFKKPNLLKYFNVYRNIEITHDLLNIDFGKDRAKKLLNNLGIDVPLNKKITKLNFYEQYKIALARAISKKPDIIIVDDPSEFLEENESEKMFNTLKKLSEKKLVIVCEDNLDIAQKYGDRIIELKDGVIVKEHNNEVSIIDLSVRKQKLVTPKLNFIKSFIISLDVILNRKLLFLMFNLIIIASLVFLGISKSMYDFDLSESHAESIINNNDKLIQITPKEGYVFNKEDTNDIISGFDEYLYGYKIYENGIEIKLEINNLNFEPSDLYNSYLNSGIEVIEATDIKQYTDSNLIGRFPTEYNEIVIHKYLADYIIHNGIIVLNSDGMKLLYRPTNYDQIINESKTIMIGSKNRVKVVGIIDDDLSKYEFLKGKNTGLKNNEKINYNNFKNMISRQANKIIALTGFVDNLELPKNNYMNITKYSLYVNNLGENKNIDGNVSYINKNYDAYTLNGYTGVTDLIDNEVLINTEFLDILFDNDYSNKLQLFKNSNIENDSEGSVFQFTLEYVRDNDILGKNYNIIIKNNKTKKEITESVVIKGVIISSKSDSYIYFSEEILDKYLDNNYRLNSIFNLSDTKEQIINILKRYIDYKDYIEVKTVVSDNFNNIISFIDLFKNMTLYISVFFVFLVVVATINHVYVFANKLKVEANILRILGTSKADIFKIFIFPIFVSIMISICLSLLIIYLINLRLNYYISLQINYNFNPIKFSKDQLLILSSVIISIIIISIVTIKIKLKKILV
ncbi:MAG TPA: ATP-binding cassette domain-containing protein [Tenericutes bacterium]|nr:ATP-binding cassette domain-containing protein [Mycoplasmatota bacterium]